MAPRKNSSEPLGKVKMGQTSSKKEANGSSIPVCPHGLSRVSSTDEREDPKKKVQYAKIICSNTFNANLLDHSVNSGIVSGDELLSEDESGNDSSSGEPVSSSENSPILPNISGVSSIAPSLSESHFTDDESLCDESFAGYLSDSTDGDSTEAHPIENAESRSEASIVLAETTILTREKDSIPTDEVELPKPPVISFYIPRENILPKTSDATKQSITPFQRINRVTKSKLFSNIITDDTTWKLKQLQKRWDSIKKITNVEHLMAIRNLDQPILINLKLIQLRQSFVNYVASVSDFNSCFPLFDILGTITLSKFEYHKIEVMMEVATPKFMNTLHNVVNALHTDRPCETKLTRFVENFVDIYVEMYLQLDSLATDGLSADLVKVVESCRELFRSEDENNDCAGYLDQLLTIISSRDSLIRADSCFPFDILKEESVESNIIDGPFDNFDQYLSIHYRLLKEDFQNSLREGILQYLKTLHGRFRRSINYHLTIYPRVTLMCDLTKYAVKYKIAFHDPVVIRRLQDPACRSFLSGALLILTPCVSFSNPSPFEYYYLVRVEDSSPLEREKSYIFVSMILGPPNFTSTMDLLMAEPSQLFEPYYRVLNMIRSLDSNQFPFTRYIVDVKTDVLPPAYMSPSTKVKIGDTICSLWEDETWPNPDDIHLNRVQLEGLKLALRSELAIIQGPPGTGKTYLSRKIVEVLLQNKNIWHKPDDDGAGLILVVCFKNQSLDQLLSGLIKAGKKVLRVGTQSKVEMLDEYNLKTLQIPNHSRIYYRMRTVLGEEQMDLMDEIIESVEIVHEIEHLQGLIKLNVLSKFLHLNEENSNYLKNHFEEWLIDLPIPLPNFNEVERILLELRAEDVYEGESMFSKANDFYHVTKQDIKDKLFVLNSKIDSLKRVEATKYLDDLSDAAAYLVRYLCFIEEQCYELNRPPTCEVHLKMMHLKLTFASPERQPPIEKLPSEHRWLLYKAWIDELYQFHSNEVRSLTIKSRYLNLRYVEIEELLNIRRIAQCDAEVIGMTTTAAAKYYKMMDCLKPKIVLVEEAAEVVEAHTVASLSKHCEHLILVGDHKQLRPLTSSHLIGREAHLDISMYERLVRNGFPHCTLNTQYRMRPEIASLIAPAVYPELTSDPSVYELPHVLGVTVDLYFVDHSVREDETPDIVSRWNRYEAEFHLALCNYLVKQGYQPSQITVLATYSEQEKYFNKEKLNYPELEDVLMATVDSFQGKENDIILLSLVRSNAEGNIGFLAQKNRINVALSRAKRGLFITGNSKNLLAKGGLWHEVVDVLSRSNAIGRSLPLKCEIHGKVTRVTTPGDVKALKNGGCSRKCRMKLACGHNCIHLCHPLDHDHKDIFRCSNLCNKVMECSHSCSLSCHFFNEMIRCFCISCSPKTKCEFKLSCGHTCTSMAHAEDVEHQAKFRCSEICNTVLKCGHICSSLCHLEDIKHEKRYKCPIICEGQLLCGHKCRHTSHKKHECSKHRTGCCSICALLLPCGHVCRRMCHNRDRSHESEFKCLQCGKVSSAKTSDVDGNHPVLKSESCPNNIELETSQPEKCVHGEAINLLCDKVCGFKRKCGHQCKEKCHSSAENHKQVCNEECGGVLAIGRCPHGLVSLCKNKCGFEYKCGHLCAKKCLHTSDATHSKPCRRQCDRPFNCGHICNQLCHFKQLDHLSRSCKVCDPGACLHGEAIRLCDKVCGFKHSCGHQCNEKCHSSPENHKRGCKNKCGFEYRCGHLCVRKCLHTSDATHGRPCRRQCGRMFNCGHPCNRLCHFKEQLDHLSRSCKVCEPGKCLHGEAINVCDKVCGFKYSCGHQCNTTCHSSAENHEQACKNKCGFEYRCGHLCIKKCLHTSDATHGRPCRRQCGRLFNCGHPCNQLCHFKENLDHLSRCCKVCEQNDDPTLSFTKKCGFKFECGHLCAKKMQHSEGASHKACKQTCKKLLTCEHSCKLTCHFYDPSLHDDPSMCITCNKTLCKKALGTSLTNVFQTCTQEVNLGESSSGQLLSARCEDNCGFKYPCGHACLQETQHSVDATHSEFCKQPCNRFLACGHQCKFECHLKSSAEHDSRNLCGDCTKISCPIFLLCGHQCSIKNPTHLRKGDCFHVCYKCPVSA